MINCLYVIILRNIRLSSFFFSSDFFLFFLAPGDKWFFKTYLDTNLLTNTYTVHEHDPGSDSKNDYSSSMNLYYWYVTCTRNTFNQTVFCDVSSALGGPLLVWVPQAHLADRQFLQFLSLSKILRCGTKKEKGAEEEGWGCLMSKA